MKKELQTFFLKGLLFITLFLLSFILLNTFFNKEIYHNKRIYKKDLYTLNFFIKEQRQSQINIGFFGNSHIIHGINPKYIENSYNFAFNGNRYTEDYYILQRAIYKFNIDFKTVVFQIDLKSFGSPNIRPYYINHMEVQHKYIPLSEINKLNNLTYKDILLASYAPFLYDNIITLTEQRIKAVQKESPYGDYFYNGWQSVDRGEKGVWDVLNENYVLEDEINLNYFLKSIKLAKDNNINIALIIMPMSKEFDKNLSNSFKIRTLYYNKLFACIENTISDNYTVLNYYDQFFNEESRKFYSDPNHLNSHGSEVFSKIIGKRFNSNSEIQNPQKYDLQNIDNLSYKCSDSKI